MSGSSCSFIFPSLSSTPLLHHLFRTPFLHFLFRILSSRDILPAAILVVPFWRERSVTPCPDVHVSLDNHLIMFHDPDLLRTTGSKGKRAPVICRITLSYVSRQV